jgi:hypothetical protein
MSPGRGPIIMSTIEREPPVKSKYLTRSGSTVGNEGPRTVCGSAKPCDCVRHGVHTHSSMNSDTDSVVYTIV